MKVLLLLLALSCLISVTVLVLIFNFPRAATAPAPAPDRTFTTVALNGLHEIQRWHDDEYGVTCWLYSKGGISCLPDAATTRP